ncbi:SPOR domain-containing protein [Paraburkholderia flava]|uniref:SPOR domain-containing protein n=1 Tax=Paraburkholderia flava TaxID=2547393 RepID=UPI00105D5A47|nr:SPOR domain-containing protein [Paraburkholderia flava]
MGIFSFGKKDDAPTRRSAPSGSGRSTRSESPRGTERRTRRTERSGDADAMLLDPTLPEKQRARRRLVGAIALVVAAVVILPMVLDSHPKPVTDDISIDIPNRPVPKASTAPDDTQAGVAPDNPATTDAGLAASGLASAGGASQSTADTTPTAPATTTRSQVHASAKPDTPAATANTTHSATNNAQTSTKPKPAQQTADNTPAAGADADSGTPASPPGGRFQVQLGSFRDEASAKSWATKLKAAGVSAYTERRKLADGTSRTMLLAGPFPDRAAASAAIAKVRGAGLTSGANGGAQ